MPPWLQGSGRERAGLLAPALQLFESSCLTLSQPTTLVDLGTPAIDDYQGFRPHLRSCPAAQSDGRGFAMIVLAACYDVIPRQERTHVR
jgi:hypothetical protein